MILTGFRLFRTVLALTAHSLVEIDVIAVEFRTFHAGEAGLAGHGDAAGAAHARSVHHQGIEADDDGGRPSFLAVSVVNFIMIMGPMATAWV